MSRLGACAARGDAGGAAEVLCRLGRSPNEMICTTLAMFEAESKGHTEVVRVLLEDGRADPVWNDNQVLRTAIVCGRVAIVRLLLADGRADPATSLNTAPSRTGTKTSSAAAGTALANSSRWQTASRTAPATPTQNGANLVAASASALRSRSNTLETATAAEAHARTDSTLVPSFAAAYVCLSCSK
jgi:hypothetical protein